MVSCGATPVWKLCFLLVIPLFRQLTHLLRFNHSICASRRDSFPTLNDCETVHIFNRRLFARGLLYLVVFNHYYSSTLNKSTVQQLVADLSNTILRVRCCEARPSNWNGGGWVNIVSWHKISCVACVCVRACVHVCACVSNHRVAQSCSTQLCCADPLSCL